MDEVPEAVEQGPGHGGGEAVNEFQLVCVRCEHRLDPCPRAERCPECGTPVSRSKAAQIAVLSEVRHADIMLRIAAWMTVVPLLLLCVAATRAYAAFRIILFPSLLEFIGFVSAGCTLVLGILLLHETAVRLERAAQSRPLRSASARRVSPVAWLAVSLACVVFSMGAAFRGYMTGNYSPVWSWLVLPFVVAQLLHASLIRLRPMDRALGLELTEHWGCVRSALVLCVAATTLAIVLHVAVAPPWRLVNAHHFFIHGWSPITALAYVIAILLTIALAEMLLRYARQFAVAVQRVSADRLDALLGPPRDDAMDG